MKQLTIYVKKASGDEKTGVDIIYDAISAPLIHIAENSGCDGSVVVAEVEENKDNIGYNAANGKFEDLVKAGVIDPAKVTRSALQNAASIAGLLLTVETMITEVKDDDKKNVAAEAIS